MKAFFESALFNLILESLFTVLFAVVVLAGNVHVITVLLLVASASGIGWHLREHLEERATRVY